MATREEKQSLYKTNRWQRLRKRVMNRDRGLCQYCLEIGVIKSANVVNHIIRHKGDPELFHDTNNLELVCQSCHDGLIAREENLADRLGVEGKVRIGCDENGIPFQFREGE